MSVEPENKNTTPSSTPGITAASAPDSTAVKTKRPRRRRWFILGGIAGVLVLVLLVVIAAAPMLISSGMFRGTILATVDDAIEGSVTWDKLDVNWGSGQRIENLRVLDAQGQTLLTVTQVDAPDVSLWSIIRGHKNLGTIHVKVDQASIIQEADGQFNLAKALAAVPSNKPSTPSTKNSNKPSQPLDGWTASLDFKGSGMDVTPLNSQTITINTLNMTADLSQPTQAIKLDFDTAMTQGKRPAGSAQGQVVLNKLMDAQGNIQLSAATADVKVNLDKLATSLLLAAAGQDPALATMTGPNLSATIALQGDLLAPSGQLTIDSSQIKGDVKFVSKNQAMMIAADSSVKMTVNQQGWNTWAGNGSSTQLQQPVTLALVVKALTLPRKDMGAGGGFDLAAMEAAIDFSVSDVTLQGNAEVGRLSLTNTRGLLKTQQFGKQLEVTFDAKAAHNQQVGSVYLQAKASDLVDGQGQFGLAKLNADVKGEVRNLPLTLADELLGQQGKLLALLGPTLEGIVTTSIKPSADGSAASGPFEVALATSQLKTKLSGSLSPDSLQVDKQSVSTLTLTAASAAAVGLPEQTLLSPVLLTLRVEQAIIPRGENGLALAQGKLKLVLDAPRVDLKGAGQVKQLAMTDIKVAIESQALGKAIQLSSSFNAQADQSRATMQAKADIQNLMDENGALQLNAMRASYDMQATQLPVVILDQIASQEGALLKWLGNTLDVRATGKVQAGQSLFEKGDMSLVMASPLLNVNTQAAIEEGMLRFDPTSTIKLTLAQDALAAQGVTLDKPMALTITLGNLSLPVSSFDLGQVKIEKMTLASTAVNFVGDSAAAGYRLSPLSGSIVAPTLGESLSVSLQTQVAKADGESSPVKIEVMIQRPLAAAGNAASAGTPVQSQVQTQGQVNVKVEHVATAFIDALAQQDGRLVALLGPQLESLTLTAQPAPAGDSNSESAGVAGNATAPPQSVWNFDVAARSRQLQIPRLSGRIALGKAVNIHASEPIALQVTPEAYDLFMVAKEEATAPVQATGSNAAKAAPAKTNAVSKLFVSLLSAGDPKGPQAQKPLEPFVIAGPFDVTLTVKQLTYLLAETNEPAPVATAQTKATAGTSPVPVTPAKPPEAAMDLSRVSLDLTAQVRGLAYERKKAGDRVTLSQMVAVVSAPDSVAQLLKVNVTGKTLTHAQDTATPAEKPVVPAQGQLDAIMTFQGLALLPEQGLDLHKLQSNWQIEVSQLPVILIDHLAGMQGKLAGLLGTASDMSMQGKLPGDLDLKMNAPHASIDGKLQLTTAFELRLREDLKMKLEVTPEAVVLLGLINPQLLALESTTSPMDLIVFKKDFSLPLPEAGQAVDVRKIRSDMNLKLGQAVLRKEGMVKTVYQVLGQFGGKFNTGERMEVTFTPLDVTIKDGQARTNDMWLISDELLMGTQVRVDMTRTPAFANVFLGISGQTLSKMPGAKKDISPEYVVEVEVASPVSEVKLDYADLVLQISPLFVKTYAGKDGQKVLDALGALGDVVDKIQKGNNAPGSQNIKVTWPNHPQPVKVEGAQTPDPAQTQPAETKPEVTPEQVVVDSLLELLKKKKK